MPGAGHWPCPQGQVKDRTEFYFRESSRCRAREWGRGEVGRTTQCDHECKRSLEGKGHRGRDGKVWQRLGWLSCEANGTRGREGGITNPGTQVCNSTLSRSPWLSPSSHGRGDIILMNFIEKLKENMGWKEGWGISKEPSFGPSSRKDSGRLGIPSASPWYPLSPWKAVCLQVLLWEQQPLHSWCSAYPVACTGTWTLTPICLDAPPKVPVELNNLHGPNQTFQVKLLPGLVLYPTSQASIIDRFSIQNRPLQCQQYWQDIVGLWGRWKPLRDSQGPLPWGPGDWQYRLSRGFGTLRTTSRSSEVFENCSATLSMTGPSRMAGQYTKSPERWPLTAVPHAGGFGTSRLTQLQGNGWLWSDAWEGEPVGRPRWAPAVVFQPQDIVQILEPEAPVWKHWQGIDKAEPEFSSMKQSHSWGNRCDYWCLFSTQSNCNSPTALAWFVHSHGRRKEKSSIVSTKELWKSISNPTPDSWQPCPQIIAAICFYF